MGQLFVHYNDEAGMPHVEAVLPGETVDFAEGNAAFVTGTREKWNWNYVPVERLRRIVGSSESGGEPVRGRFKYLGQFSECALYQCSNCKGTVDWPTKFCPNCGADMRGTAGAGDAGHGAAAT